jgi:hypothetical protein
LGGTWEAFIVDADAGAELDATLLVPEVSVVSVELVEFAPGPESPIGSSPSPSSPPSSEESVVVEFTFEEDSGGSSLQSSSPPPESVVVEFTFEEDSGGSSLQSSSSPPESVVVEFTFEEDSGGSSLQSPSSPPESLGLLVGVLVELLMMLVGELTPFVLAGVVLEAEAAPLVPFPAPVNPPLAPEALMRDTASCSVSQAILVPFELTRGSAKHERPPEH